MLGKLNLADLFTKYLDQNAIEQHVATLKYTFADGRTSEGPKVNNVSISIDEYEPIGQWKEWEWSHMINSCVQVNGDGTQKNNNGKLCRGEINLCKRSIQTTHYTTESRNSSHLDLGQSVLQGYKRQVQGFNGLQPALPCRPWGSAQTLPSRHNEAQRPRQDGRAVVKAWGIAHIPRVDLREDRIRLPSEKGQNRSKGTSEWSVQRKIQQVKVENNEARQQMGWDQQRGPLPGWDIQLTVGQLRWTRKRTDETGKGIDKVERRAVSPRQPECDITMASKGLSSTKS